MKETIWFDMDGTLADLYGVENWLENLVAENPKPYKVANPMLNLRTLARKLNNLQRKGYQLGIISWCSKNSTPTYDKKVTSAKTHWLKKHLPSVKWDYIKIVPYGTNKWEECNKNGILFDDEERNRLQWKNGKSFSEQQIFLILNFLAAQP